MKMTNMVVTGLAAVTLSSAATAMGNPASVFCRTMGGKSVVPRLRNGDELGLCYLGHRQIVEEWTLYRMFNGKKLRPADNPFRAQ